MWYRKVFFGSRSVGDVAEGQQVYCGFGHTAVFGMYDYERWRTSVRKLQKVRNREGLEVTNLLKFKYK